MKIYCRSSCLQLNRIRRGGIILIDVNDILIELLVSEITDYVARLICSSGSSQTIACGVGSTFLRGYLPESDVDLVVLDPQLPVSDVPKSAIFRVFSNIFAAAEHVSSIPKPLTIRSVEFVNARINVISCVVNNARVDITVNQIGAVATNLFLEEASRIIGNNFLFKKSLILIKVSTVIISMPYFKCFFVSVGVFVKVIDTVAFRYVDPNRECFHRMPYQLCFFLFSNYIPPFFLLWMC